MKFQYLTATILSVVSVSFYANGFSSTQPTAFYSGECWGGAEDPCGEWDEVETCIFLAPDAEPGCTLHVGEVQYENCSNIDCKKFNNKWKCTKQEVRKFNFDSGDRTVTEQRWGVRVRVCTKLDSDNETVFDKCKAEANLGSAQEFEAEVPCFIVTTCHREEDTCAVNDEGTESKCKSKSTKFDGAASNKTPNPEFPCGTETRKEEALEDCYIVHE